MKKLIPISVLLFVILGCKQPEPSSSPAPTPAPQSRKLSADMQLSGRGIVIKNTDTADWPSVTMKVNLTQWGSDDGRADIGPVAMGRAVTVPYGEFTVGTKRFSPRETKILTIYVKSGDGSAKLFLCPGTTCIESPK